MYTIKIPMERSTKPTSDGHCRLDLVGNLGNQHAHYIKPELRADLHENINVYCIARSVTFSACTSVNLDVLFLVILE